MKSLDYLEDIMENHCLSNLDMAEILENLAYIARDNGIDDKIFDALGEVLEERI